MNRSHNIAVYLALLALGLVAPFFAYPVFLMKALCFALFACARHGSMPCAASSVRLMHVLDRKSAFRNLEPGSQPLSNPTTDVSLYWNLRLLKAATSLAESLNHSPLARCSANRRCQ